jgi:hypothetical protein
MTLRFAALAALLLGTALTQTASAQAIRPGLWEMTNTMGGQAASQAQSAMAEMQKEMAAMSPEERAVMEKMMTQNGVKLNIAPGGGMVTKLCMTPEMAKRSQLPIQQSGECSNRQSTSGSKMTFSFTCNNPRSSGEGEVVFSGDTSYKMKMKVVSGSGKADTMTMDASGKWLGANCGDVKPLAVPKR